ncbi:MAG: ABC transporter ATP-binding protein [Lachnospiraceae bacterium]|nr:ABC transporter ATP-binding protein [Lachnospiraceae bacterium]
MKEKKYGLFKMVRYVVETGWKNCSKLFMLFLILTVGRGACTAANVLFKQSFFDAVEKLVYGNENVAFAVKCGIVMAAFLILTLVMQAAGELLEINLFQVIMGYMGKALNDKASRIDPIVYEDNRLLDSINKAAAGIEASIQAVTAVLVIGLREAAYFIFMGCYFFSVKPMLLVMFTISFIPVIISSQIRRKMYANLENQAAPYRRKYEYFGRCIYSREYAKETRLWRADNYFGNLFRENLRRATVLNWDATKKSELVEVVLRFVSLFGYVGTIVLMFCYLMRGDMGIGAFAAIFSSLDQMFDRMEDVFNHRIYEIMRSFGPAQNYFAFLDLPEREGTYEKKLERNEIVLKNVDFSYPCSDKKALEDINLTIRKGETLAVVGVNGSGKSTLTRILTGMYLPTDGSVKIDGIDVTTISPKTLYRGVSSVFQKYQCYKMTVRENAQISDGESRKNAEPVLRQADFPLDNGKFTEGMDTMLGKDFGGIDLSGGQWQRLAIARGLYRGHDMIILDEPTAAIDPIEEANIYRKFAEISKDKTAIIVTHRLGSVHMADRIIVMDAGRIVDMGAHDELMKKKGLYYQMYQAQAKWYA